MGIKLHIGCFGQKLEGFKRLDAQQYGDVDYVQNAKDLSNFETDSVEEIYASHIFEHFTKPEAQPALNEWFRVLKPNGVLYISVPDFARIVEIYHKMGDVYASWLDHLLHGDQGHPYAFHYCSYTYQTLSSLLSTAGFRKIKQITHLPYKLADASEITDNFFKIPISLSIKAVK